MHHNLCQPFSPPLLLGFDLSGILFPFPLGKSGASWVLIIFRLDILMTQNL